MTVLLIILGVIVNKGFYLKLKPKSLLYFSKKIPIGLRMKKIKRLKNPISNNGNILWGEKYFFLSKCLLLSAAIENSKTGGYILHTRSKKKPCKAWNCSCKRWVLGNHLLNEKWDGRVDGCGSSFLSHSSIVTAPFTSLDYLGHKGQLRWTALQLISTFQKWGPKAGAIWDLPWGPWNRINLIH